MCVCACVCVCGGGGGFARLESGRWRHWCAETKNDRRCTAVHRPANGWPDCGNGHVKGAPQPVWIYAMPTSMGRRPIPHYRILYLELRPRPTSREPRARAAASGPVSAPGRRPAAGSVPPVRARGRGASPGAGRGYRPPGHRTQQPILGQVGRWTLDVGPLAPRNNTPTPRRQAAGGPRP
jgi:hypothetical protein